jgi:hypothetical protein
MLRRHDKLPPSRHRGQIAHRPKDTTFTALGVIAHCQPNMGMGVRFTDVQLDQHKILDKWLEALVRD